MIREIVADLLADPGRALLAALLGLCIIMVFPVIFALRRKAREAEREREREARRRPLPLRRLAETREPREPRFGPVPYIDDDDDDDDDDDEPYSRGGFGAGPPRRGIKPPPVGTLTKVAWFGLGIAVGAGLMALNAGMLDVGSVFRMPIERGPDDVAEGGPPPVVGAPEAASTKSDAGRIPEVEDDPVRIAEEALANLPPSAPPPEPAAPPPPAVALPAEPSVDAQVAAFVSGMQPQLPMAIGSEISLIKVTALDRVVTLAFAIQRAIPESDYPALQKLLEQRFREGICKGKDSLGIRALNQAGVAFSVLYSDLIGKTAAHMEVLPNYCRTG